MIDFCWVIKMNVLMKTYDNSTHILLKYGRIIVTFRAKVFKFCFDLIFAPCFYNLI